MPTVDETFYLDVSLFGTELLGSQVALQADGKILATVEEFNGDIDYVVRFNSDVLIRSQSAFTGKIKYRPLTDVDVETTKAIIEVTTQADAGGKAWRRE